MSVTFAIAAAAGAEPPPPASPLPPRELPGGGGGQWCPWLSSVPASVLTPLEFDADEVLALGDAAAMREARDMQLGLRACFEV